MRCSEIMKTDVECVAPQDSVQAAAAKMRDENVGFLPVCDASERVLGTLTDRDLAIRIVAGGQLANTPVRAAMTREVIACRPEDDLSDAEALMSDHHKSRIMCVDEQGRLVGVISLSDIAQIESPGLAAQSLRKISEREIRP